MHASAGSPRRIEIVAESMEVEGLHRPMPGFPRSLPNLDVWYQIFGPDAELPQMLYFECPFEELEKRVLGRAKYSGRGDDNIESLKLRFDTFKQRIVTLVGMNGLTD